MGFKWIFMLSLALLQAVYYRRLKWSVLKSRKLVLDVVNLSNLGFLRFFRLNVKYVIDILVFLDVPARLKFLTCN